MLHVEEGNPQGDPALPLCLRTGRALGVVGLWGGEHRGVGWKRKVSVLLFLRAEVIHH